MNGCCSGSLRTTKCSRTKLKPSDIQDVESYHMALPEFGNGTDEQFVEQNKLIASFKKALLLTAGAAVQKLMMKLESEQEILMNVADIAIQTFNAESALLRLIKLAELKGAESVGYETDIVKSYLYDAADRINKSAKDAINAFADGDEQRMMLMGVRRFTKASAFNTKAAKRRIAEKLIADGKYPL